MPCSRGESSDAENRYEDTALVKSTILREQRKFSDMNIAPGCVGSAGLPPGYPGVIGAKLRR